MQQEKQHEEHEAVKGALDRLTAELWENTHYASGTQIARQISNLCYSYKKMYPDLAEKYQSEIKQWRAQVIKTRREEMM